MRKFIHLSHDIIIFFYNLCKYKIDSAKIKPLVVLKLKKRLFCLFYRDFKGKKRVIFFCATTTQNYWLCEAPQYFPLKPFLSKT